VEEHGGRLVSAAADLALASFSAPGQAIRCAHALLADPSAAAGIHTGEVELAGDDVIGAAVEISAHLAALARPGEVLVSRTVRDLVAGSGYQFSDRGSRRLGPGGENWRLFGAGPPAP
jgi:class 3 adenylate cyclase